MKFSGLALGTVLYPHKLVSTRFGVMDTPIDVDEDNQWKHDSEFIKIIKNMYDTCFIYNFSSGYVIFSETHLGHVLYLIF